MDNGLFTFIMAKGIGKMIFVAPLPYITKDQLGEGLALAEKALEEADKKMAFFPFSDWTDSFFGNMHGQGMDAVGFFTQKKVLVERWPKEWSRKCYPRPLVASP